MTELGINAGRRAKACLCWLTFAVLLAGCTDLPSATLVDLPRPIRLLRMRGEPIAQMVSQLKHAKHIRLLQEFSSSVPQSIPDLALPLVSFIETDQLSEDAPLIVRRQNGYVVMNVIVANAGSNPSRLKLMCLRAWVQAACSPSADVLEMTLPSHSMVIAPIKLPASSGDFILFTLSAENDYKRVQAASQRLFAFVDHVSLPNDVPRLAPLLSTHQTLGGCDFAALLPALPENNTYRNPGIQPKGKTLYLLTQLCHPEEGQIIRFVPVIDGERLAAWSDSTLASWVRLTGSASVVRIVTSELQGSRVLQFAVVSLDRDGRPGALSNTRFTAATKLSP